MLGDASVPLSSCVCSLCSDRGVRARRESICFFTRPGGSVNRPGREPVTLTNKRNAVTEDRVREREAEWSAQPLAPGVEVEVRGKRRVVCRSDVFPLDGQWRYITRAKRNR
eukprot:COSAG01_NODE_143_length_24153_cov_54.226116_20_plen_111_part_00